MTHRIKNVLQISMCALDDKRCQIYYFPNVKVQRLVTKK